MSAVLLQHTLLLCCSTRVALASDREAGVRQSPSHLLCLPVSPEKAYSILLSLEDAWKGGTRSLASEKQAGQQPLSSCGQREERGNPISSFSLCCVAVLLLSATAAVIAHRP